MGKEAPFSWDKPQREPKAVNSPAEYSEQLGRMSFTLKELVGNTSQHPP
jgi:hypothetical protein